MSAFQIQVEGSTPVRLPTAGKYCDRDVIVTPEDLTENLSNQEALITQIQAALAGKAAPGAGLPTQEKAMEITENGTYEVTPDDGYALSRVAVTANVAAGGDPLLPQGYWRCEYILFSGDQIVDTGQICNQSTKIRVDFTRERTTQHYLYGVASSDNKASVTAYLGGSWRFGSKSATKTITTRADMAYSAIVSGSEITITGNAASLSAVEEFETIGSLLIGSCRSATGEVGDPQFAGKIMAFQMENDGLPVLNLVPVTDGTVFRFWDTVGKKFHDSITDTPLLGLSLK